LVSPIIALGFLRAYHFWVFGTAFKLKQLAKWIHFESGETIKRHHFCTNNLKSPLNLTDLEFMTFGSLFHANVIAQRLTKVVRIFALQKSQRFWQFAGAPG